MQIKKKHDLKRYRAISICLLAALFLVFSIFIAYRLVTKRSTEAKVTAADVVKLVETKILPVKSESVCLDPGHGGKDAGAIYRDIYESNINLVVALKVKAILESDGYKVFMTRSDDTFVYKRPRATYCNSTNADIMVSIHHNSYDSDHTVNYSTAMYYKKSDQLLASGILDAVSDKLATRNEGIAKFDNSLLWIAKMPAAMSEAFFITNNSEYSSLLKANSTLLADEAEGIATGIVNYFTHPDQIQSSISDDSLSLDRTDLGE